MGGHYSKNSGIGELLSAGFTFGIGVFAAKFVVAIGLVLIGVAFNMIIQSGSPTHGAAKEGHRK